MAPTTIFRGDADGLVDALIAACERKPVAESAMPALFGRELVPWADDFVEGCGPLGQPLEAGRGRNFPAKHPRPTERTTAPKRTRAATPPRAAPAGFACPALAASPKPEALPMPTTGLLSRAFVRGRSPSPPKDHFAVMPLAQVRAVAA